jgi:hypothetical protein
MKRSVQVTLTVLAAVGSAARAQAPNPWVPQLFQKYPSYYGLYRAYASAGGIVTAAPMETCRRSSPRTGGRGGFGATGATVHSQAGS